MLYILYSGYCASYLFFFNKAKRKFSFHQLIFFIFYSVSGYDEHLFELNLKTPCVVGHIDVKVNLHPLCTTVPDIQVR